MQGSADTRPLPAPSLQASAPGSAVDYPLQGLVTHTNYTATLRGLRGPNFTSPASITFTTGVVLEVHGTGWRWGSKRARKSLISIFSSFRSQGWRHPRTWKPRK